MSTDNTYQPPQADLTVKSSDFDEVLRVAKRQKILLFVFLSYLLLVVANTFLPPELQAVVGFAVIGLALAIIIFTGALSWLVYGKLMTVVFVVLSIVPLVNMLVVLAVNARATKKIKESGIKVGFMGASKKSLALATA